MSKKHIDRRQDRNSYAVIRKKRKQIFNLRIRLMLFVTLELLASVFIAYIVNFIVNDIVFWLINNYILTLFFPLEVALPHFSFTIPLFRIVIPLWIHLITISVLVGIIATFGLSLWLLRPIKKLEQSIAKIADGDFSVRINKRSSVREIQKLYAGFNLMADELQATEILQTDFVSNVSHEFKTPINAIEGYSMLLQGSGELSDEQREYVDKILFNTKRLSTLTGSILLLSKIENQKISTDKTKFRLDEQIRETIVALEPSWSQRDVEFDVDMEDTEYFGSEMLMYHVWSNLLSNAVKFGPAGGTITVRLYAKRKHIYVTVADQGAGLSEDAKKHIFDKFYQGDSSHKAEGNGLGLTLVKKILDLEGGEISADNIEGGGCSFTVKLKRIKQKGKLFPNYPKFIDKYRKK